MNRNTQAAFERALTNLDPGPPPPTPDEQLLRHIIKFHNAVSYGPTHELRWVIHPDIRDQLLKMSRQVAVFNPSPTPDTVETLMGLPVRLDEHATAIMMELR